MRQFTLGLTVDKSHIDQNSGSQTVGRVGAQMGRGDDGGHNSKKLGTPGLEDRHVTCVR